MAEDEPRGPRPLTPREEVEHAARAFMWLMRIREPRPEVPFVAMPPSIAAHIAGRLGLGSDDRIVDIGCGDGRTLIALVGESGCRGIGLERDAERVAEARAAVAEAGLDIRIVHGDFEDPDDLDRLELDRASAVVLFLYPWAVELLIPTLAARLPPGARVASYCFSGPRFVTDDREQVEGFAYPGHRVPLYIWTLDRLRAVLAGG